MRPMTAVRISRSQNIACGSYMKSHPSLWKCFHNKVERVDALQNAPSSGGGVQGNREQGQNNSFSVASQD